MPSCADKASGSAEFLEFMGRKAIEERIPLSGTLDLTHRCNLNCVHCYLGDKAAAQRRRTMELSARRWNALLDELAGAGCLYLLLSGGEPLLRADFHDIYAHAKKLGMLVSVFSNATTLNDAHLALFRDLPPEAVEISLYGASETSYERITGQRGAFSRCLKGIEALLGAGVRVRLKTVLMNQNRSDLPELRRLAREFGVDFRFDAAIFSGLDGQPLPEGIRIDPRDAVALEMEDDQRRRQWRRYHRRMHDEPVSDLLYRCGAGETNFYVDPYGVLTPCLMVPEPRYDLRTGPFAEGWYGVIAEIRNQRADAGFVCGSCEKRHLCEVCPAFFRIETGSEQIRSDYICRLGHYRYRAVMALEGP